MSHAICTLASIPLRRHADFLSEMTSQLLFGDHYEILESKSTFQRIRIASDGYEGWVSSLQGEPITEDYFNELSADPPEMLLDIVAPAQLGDRKLYLVRGSHLPPAINGQKLTCHGTTLNPSRSGFTTAHLERLASDYINAPYLWGGRSPFGIDCSGFTQMALKLLGIRLPRDSRDQAMAGRPVRSLADSRPGDLAFFSDDSSHVGLITSRGILHAASCVRLDDIDDTGIRDRQSGQYSHHLSSIRRVLDPQPH